MAARGHDSDGCRRPASSRASSGPRAIVLTPLPVHLDLRRCSGRHSTGLYALGRQNLSSQTEVSATLGYAGSYSVVNQAQGTFTSLSAVGQVVSQGQVLYRVSDTPVVLLYGATPAYRSLSEGMTGADVEELNADLVAGSWPAQN